MTTEDDVLRWLHAEAEFRRYHCHLAIAKLLSDRNVLLWLLAESRSDDSLR